MTFDRIIVFAAGVFGTLALVRGFRTGDASGDGRIRRDEKPALYWSLALMAVAIVASFFYFGIFWDRL
jgi:hypothetical protein